MSETLSQGQQPVAQEPTPSGNSSPAVDSRIQPDGAADTQEVASKTQEPATESIEQKIERVRREAEEKAQREWQGKTDRLLHQQRQLWQRQMEEQASAERMRERISTMSDEEYGSFVRENERLQATLNQQVQTTLANTFIQLAQDVLSVIPDDKVRAEIAERSSKGEFKNFTEFAIAAQKAAMELEKKKMIPAMEKSIREALAKEAKAKESQEGPELGTGLPHTHKDLDSLSSFAKISLGVAQAFNNKK